MQVAEAPQPQARTSPGAEAKKRKAFWTKQFYLWHWVSSAICLAAMLLFAVTGVTLNHAGAIKKQPEVTSRSLALSAEMLAALAPKVGEGDSKKPLPEDTAKWLCEELRTKVSGKTAEWSEFEIYVSLPRPGGDAWLTIDRESGKVEYELTKRGAVSYLNDLHKGRNTGPAWAWFIDIFSVACVIFCLTGLALLWVHARRRPKTWPVVAMGVLLPLIIIVFFIH